jgi:hypothetical protein
MELKMKNQSYFSHDFYAIADPKLFALYNQFGLVGYGLYWRVVEMLHTAENNQLELKEYLYQSINQHNSTSVEQIKAMLNYAINECELFQCEDGFIYSNRVNKNINTMQEIKEKRSKAGKISAELRKTATRVEHISTNGNTTQQNKIKENKIKENNKNTYSYELYSMFIQSYENEIGLEYEITAEKKDIAGITKIANLYKKKNPDNDTETAKHDLQRFFKNCCNVNDNFLRNNLNPTFIANNINKFKIAKENKPIRNQNANDKSDYQKRRGLTPDEYKQSKEELHRSMATAN